MVLLGFTGFLPGFTGFYRVLPDFTGFNWVFRSGRLLRNDAVSFSSFFFVGTKWLMGCGWTDETMS